MKQLLKIKYLWNTDLLININLRTLKQRPISGQITPDKKFFKKTLYLYNKSTTMKIKKNGVTINLTEAEINKLSKSLLKEEDKLSVETRLDKLEKNVKNLMSTMKEAQDHNATRSNRV